MSQLKNDRLLKAIFREPVDATPIWIMRQAGRYLPEYRETRAKAGHFLTLCKTPELACEVTLQPLQRFDLDAGIIFSDILTIPDAMGLGLQFAEGEGPYFSSPLKEAADIAKLHVPDKASLAYVYDAIKLVKHELAGKVPLIGFSGSPWTLAAYMVQGKGKTGFPLPLKLMQEDPLLLHNLLDILAQSVSAHLNAQIEAGADVVMLFDTWGGLLDTNSYLEFSLFYMKQVISGLLRTYNNKRIPTIVFSKGGTQWISQIALTGCEAIGLDWEMSLKEARVKVENKTALQGNMHPALLLETPTTIRKEVKRILDDFGQGFGHIFNLGHGITPEVDPEHVKILVDTVHELSARTFEDIKC